MVRKKTKQTESEDLFTASGSGATDEAKKKALDAALTDITKRFGDGTVIRLGDAQHMVVDTIPSGSLTLDIALGVGGIPRGRIVEIYGPESAGKCVTKDTFCLSGQGLVTVEEMFAMTGHKASCTNRIAEQAFDLVNETGRLETTSHFTWNNRKPIKRIRTAAGFTLEATHNHRVRVLNSDGYIVWRKAGELQPGDSLVLLRGTEQYGQGDLTTDEAAFLGYLVADGALSEANRTAFSNSDPEVIADYTRIVGTLTATPLRSYAKTATRTVDHHLNDATFRAALHERYGLEYTTAAGKTVPLCVRTAGREAQIAFLRAYFELECSIDPERAAIEVSSASYALLHQVQLMLLNLGLVSLLREKLVNDVTYYRLVLSGLEYARYGELIGFQTSARQAAYAARPSRTQTQTNFDSIPHLGGLLRALYDGVDTDREGYRLMGDYFGDAPKADLTYDRLARIIAYMDAPERSMGHAQWLILEYLKELHERAYFFDSVAAIEDDEQPTFDVVMPETHSFWSNGLISHNTTLCLHIIAEAQKRGGLAAFVDMEHALDPSHAARIGVNIDTLYVSQPDTGEQALEIVESLVRSGALDVVVLDSVAALVPRAEIEGEMGDSFVGLQARLMSQALRKLSGAIKQSNVAVLFTNQIREKIGVMYGCFHRDTPVWLADGSTERIGTLVDQRIAAEVMSFNVNTGQFEPRRIVNWFNNGPAESFLRFNVGPREFTCTPNHLLLSDNGYVPAADVRVGDVLLVALPMPELVLADGRVVPQHLPVFSSVTHIEPVTGDTDKYDIEVEGNHCYLVDGVTVHNSPETQPGGRALKFYASVRLDVRRVQAIKQGGETIGNRTKVRVTKNKVAAPFKEAEFDIMFYEGGISKTGEIIDLGVDLGIVDKRGAFFRYHDQLLGQGRENAKVYLRENPSVSEEIEAQIRASNPAAVIKAAADDDDGPGAGDE